ncbi:MAG: hypothetical protein JSU01_00085 [Bacteroidetes bacterium]|nr:hypothetical protein [Bacteroidota bacterium]
MKTLKLSMIAVALAFFSISACKKDSTSASGSVSTDQAADLAASALSSNSGGVASMADDISANAAIVASVGGPSVNSVGLASEHQACGTTLTDSVTHSGSDSSVSFNYFRKYSHTLNCNAQSQPDNLVNTMVSSGSFSGPRISTTAKDTANATIAGLTQAAANFVINGDFKRHGTFQSQVGNKASGNSYLDVVITNLTLSKPGRAIVSGSGTFTLTGTAGKVNYSYSGTITFNGNGTVTLNVTGGSSYTINLGSGECKRH